MTRKTAKMCLVLATLVLGGMVLVCSGCRKTAEKKVEKEDTKVDKVFESGPLTVHVRLDKSKMTIAETATLELEAAIGQGYKLQMPKVVPGGPGFENFGLVDWHNKGDKLDEKNKVVTTYDYRLEPLLSGKYTIPAFTFEFRDVNGTADKKYELSSEPIDVEVTSLLGEDRAKLTIADIEGVVDMPRKFKLWWAMIAAVVIVIAVAAGGWIYLRGKRAGELIRIFKPAHEIALEQLRTLVAEDLVVAGKLKEFYERISNILRHYIENRFDLRAPERTTEEFLNELAVTDLLSGEDKKDIGEFLGHCDLVKFAKHNPTTEQIQRTFDLVKDFVSKTRSEERKVDVTDAIEGKEVVEVGNE